MARVLLEVCVDSPEGLAAAMAGGADRIELCSALALGGLTPSPALVAAATRCGLPVVAMIRPRPGGFVWTARELDLMRAEIGMMREAGLAGVVIGASGPHGLLDHVQVSRLAEATEGMEVVLHRCFDLDMNPVEALERAIASGVHRVLTSGGRRTATEAVEELALMHRAARGRIEVMPGAGITADTVGPLLGAAAFASVHASCSVEVADPPRAVAMGFAPPRRRDTSEAEVRRLRAALDAP